MKESRAKPKNTIDFKFSKIDANNSIGNIMDLLCNKYCQELDEIMTEINDMLEQHESTEIPTQIVEDWILHITSILYFTISGMEEVGLKEDMCKSIRQELYTKAHEQTSGTVAERQNQAILEVQEEDLVLQIYSRAYKRIKQKVDAGYEMQSALKKIMSARITDSELSNSRYSGKER